MEEVFLNIKHYLEHRFVSDICEQGTIVDLAIMIRDLHLNNLKTIIDIAAAFDANKFTTDATFLGAGDFLKSSYIDFRTLFPLIDFDNYSGA